MKPLTPLFVATMVVACSPQPPVQPAQAPAPTVVGSAAVAPTQAPQAAFPTAITVTCTSPQAKAAFERGMELRDAARWAEAAAQFKKAGDLDPDFALAKAFECLTTAAPADAAKAGESALAKSAALPSAERAAVEALVATQRNELDKALGAWRRVTELAPSDWRGHAELAVLANMWMRQYDVAVPAARKALELNPRAAWAYNTLGYALLGQKKIDEGIAALTKAVELLPNEANPRDSLGEACLQAGRLEEAEANFKKAVELLPSFGMAWSALGETQGLRGDWKGANDTFAKAVASAMSPQEKANVRMQAAMTLLAQRKKAEALKMLDDMEAEAKAASPDGYAWAPLNKALVLIEAGEPAKALRLVAEGLARADALGTSSGTTVWLRSQGLGLKVRAEAELKKNDDAEKSIAALEAVQKANAGDPYVLSDLHAARAHLLLAKGDAAAAAAELARCMVDDPIAQRTRMNALEKAGDKVGAQAVRLLLAKPVRNPAYLLVYTKLPASPAPATPSKGGKPAGP
jgi:tetratricopeptide (TPR) repeat protein